MFVETCATAVPTSVTREHDFAGLCASTTRSISTALFRRSSDVLKGATQCWLYLLLFCCWLSLAGAAPAQTTSGVISGQVTDSQGAALPATHITLTNELTAVSQSITTDKNGYFTFPVVKPGTYTVTAEKKGFEETQTTGVTLLATNRLSVGTIRLKVGSVSTVVDVTSAVTPVQTTSSERSVEITSDQMAGLLSEGRDFTSLLRIVPGSTYEGAGNLQLNAASVGNFNGNNNNFSSVNTDGVLSSLRNLGVVEAPLNMDAIEEVTVLDANYQAEYGRVGGAIVDVVSKSGTDQFHGNVSYYLRNEAMNANNFFNNRNDVPRPYYRYNTLSATIGGPIFGPKSLKALKSKLFFFYAQDYEPDKAPEGIGYYTMPTALERAGNFSQSVNSSGQLYTVTDPTTGAPYPGNVITAGINPNMQALLNIFPEPNFTNRAVSNGNYNYVFSDSANNPAHQESLRIDYDPSAKLRFYFRGTDLYDDSTGRNEPTIYNAYWQSGTSFYNTSAPSFAFNMTYVPTARMTNELSAGIGLWYETSGASQQTLNQFSKAKQGVSLPQLYPANNPLDLLPGVEFDNIPSAAGFSYDPRFPMNDVVIAPSFSDGLSYVKGRHNMKFGAYWDNEAYKQAHHSGNGSFSGYLDFAGPNPNNPNNTGYAFAEALLGYYDTYSESSARPTYYGVTTDFEWYAQDNWRATRKLTLDYGLRFTADIPNTLKNKQGSTLIFADYNAADAPPFFQPVEVGGQEMMIDPENGQLYPAAYLDHFVPGVGNPAPGSLAASSPNFPGFFKSEGVFVAPRLGFAYDIFGDGKAALRGGFGIMYNERTQAGTIGNATFNPPTIYYPTQYYGNVSDLATTPGILSPSSTSVLQYNAKLPELFNITLGLQQEIGFKTVLDIAYVGILGRYLPYTYNANEVPYGAEFVPAHQDLVTNTPLPDDYYRPYPGYNTISYQKWGDNSNYHSLQVQLKRNFSNGLSFGIAYTWSKALDDNKGTTYIPFSETYGPTQAGSDRPQRLVGNWLWDLPKPSHIWNNVVTRTALDNWQISGIATFSSGAPSGVGFSTTDGANITGGGDGASVTRSANPTLSRGDRTFDRWFNTSVFSRTPQGSSGNSWNAFFYGPGINDWDTALIKNLKLKHLTFELRGEAYNVFNHTQFSSVNTSALFDPSGNQVNTGFGQLNGARDPRIMQVALKVKF